MDEPQKDIIPIQRLIDLNLAYNIVPDFKFHYKWQLISDWQFNTLKDFGLKPQHYLLDFGCGPLRLGMQAIPYLENGHYFGIDALANYIALGKKIIDELGITQKYTTLLSDTFDFHLFKQKFDYGMAQSVFTHMSLEQIKTCVARLKNTMQPSGKFIFTYSTADQPLGFFYFGIHPMIYGANCSETFLADLAQQNNFKFEVLNVPHPSGQKVALFSF